MIRTIYLSIFTILLSGLLNFNLVSQDRTNETTSKNDLTANADLNKWEAPKEDLCTPEYSSGCGYGDGFNDFAVEEIENYNSGCADLNGEGWSQYLGLGPAILFPGNAHDFIMQTGYDDQFVTIWIDFDDDFELEEDEKVLIDFEMTQSGQLYTATVTLPADAQEGMHYMRARTNWQNSASDPCESYGYGEAEDYYVVVGTAEFGSVEGLVSDLESGDPIEGATINLEGLYNYSTSTNSDGSYLIENMFTGDYELTCSKEGYNSQNTTVTIEEDITTYQDFSLTHPEIIVDPLSLDITMAQNTTQQETIVVENTGNGQLDWAASIQVIWDSKDYLDLQFEYPVAGGTGEAGIESDGNYIYTIKWNGNDVLKYDLEGNYIGSFAIDGVSGIRDLAFDGTYFYGGPGVPLVVEMDFENQVLVSTFTPPTSIRAIAYNDSEDVFYANNWSSTVFKFDKSGAALGSFEVGPTGENYYGFAYDEVSPGGPFLWGYAQDGESMNEIVQMQLPSGTETGFTLDITSVISGPSFNVAGGLFTHPNLILGEWTLGGVVQNEWLWGLSLGDAQTWIGMEPNIGTLAPGDQQEIIVHFDATDLDEGEHNADILFTSYPEVGTPVVNVSLLVSESAYFPCDLITNVNCTDVELSWSICPPNAPAADSFNIYRDNELIAVTYETAYIDSLLNPESIYLYKVTAMYDGIESSPTSDSEISIPLPSDLEPTNAEIVINGTIITLIWDAPDACVNPAGYNIYRDGNLLAYTEETSFQPDWGNHSYHITAVYYFGESMPSNTVIMTGISKSEIKGIAVYPNPVREKLYISSEIKILDLKLIDSGGKLIFDKEINQSANQQIDLSNLNPGIYYLIIDTEDGKVLEKVIKE